MGNQREIRQVQPLECLGVLLRVRPEALPHVRALFDNLKDRFYTRVEDVDGTISFPNLDGPDTQMSGMRGTFVRIQSGGKMWCGYENFVDHIRQIAPFVDDATFFVGDESGDIDEFVIRDRSLEFRRVHHGPWVSLEDYFELSK